MGNLVIPLLILSGIIKNSRLNMVFHIADCFGNPISQASVSIKSTAENRCWYCRTNKWGFIKTRYLPPGNYEIVISKFNYETLYIYKKICSSVCFRIRLDSKKNCVYGYIKDIDGCIVSHATVVLYRVICPEQYTPIRYTYTDCIGEYHFIDIPQGNYLIKSIK